MKRRETLLLLAFAVWGFAIGVALLPRWNAPAPPGQLPGFATVQGFDAHGPFRFIASLIVLTLALPLLLRPVARRLAADDAKAWARNAAIAAPVVALWFAIIDPTVSWVVLLFGAAIAAFTLLRRLPVAFTRRDWILLPTFSTTLLGLVDAFRNLPLQRAVILAALLVVALRIAVARIPSPLPAGLAFLFAPLGLVLQTNFFARDQRYFGWHALAIVAVTPFLARLFLRNERRAVALLTFAIYPIAAYAYVNAMSMETAEGKGRVYFFEDSHSLPIASDYLRGEKPYRDVLPVHGLLEDGYIDYLAFRMRDVTVGATQRMRLTTGTMNAMAIYALGTAMTGVPEVGIVTFYFWNLTGSTLTLRLTPALFTLALIVLAVRKRNPRYLIAAGFGVVVCGITSLDYAFYTTVILAVAALRFRPPLTPSPSPRSAGRGARSEGRWLAVRNALIGIALATVPLFVALAASGILDDFFRATFLDVPSLGSVYTLGFFRPPPGIGRIHSFPELLGALLIGDSMPYLVWCGVALATAVLLAKPRRRRREPFLLVGLWIVLAAISYAERQHIYFNAVLGAMVIPATWVAVRRRVAFAPILIAAVLVASLPTTHLGIVGWVRRLRGPAEPGWTEVREIPRARGTLFLPNEAASLRAAKRYADLALGPNETFFDFTNRAILFYFLRRDNPIPYVETAYYETEERQREVIALLANNPNVRAALIPDPGGTAVDGVPNHIRAPLVWEYLRQNFYPDFREGDIVFWRRR